MDYFYHSLGTVIVFFTVYVLSLFIHSPLHLALILSALVGIGKELLDVFIYGQAPLNSVEDVLGNISGLIICLLILGLKELIF